MVETPQQGTAVAWSDGQAPHVTQEQVSGMVQAAANALAAHQHAALNAVFTAIARVLAVRLQLLLSLLGAFVLAVLAMAWQTPAGLYVMIAWCCLSVLPLVWLEWSGRPRAPMPPGA